MRFFSPHKWSYAAFLTSWPFRFTNALRTRAVSQQSTQASDNSIGLLLSVCVPPPRILWTPSLSLSGSLNFNTFSPSLSFAHNPVSFLLPKLAFSHVLYFFLSVNMLAHIRVLLIQSLKAQNMCKNKCTSSGKSFFLHVIFFPWLSFIYTYLKTNLFCFSHTFLTLVGILKTGQNRNYTRLPLQYSMRNKVCTVKN